MCRYTPSCVCLVVSALTNSHIGPEGGRLGSRYFLGSHLLAQVCMALRKALHRSRHKSYDLGGNLFGLYRFYMVAELLAP